MAYADDIVIQSSSIQELIEVLREFDWLTPEWGLALNRRKCELLLMKNFEHKDKDIEVDKIVQKVRYLGMQLSTDISLIGRDAKTSIQRNLHAIKGRL